MSKASRSRRKDKRLKEKRARKSAERAKYESYKLQGNNKKSKRFLQNNKKQKKVKQRHQISFCGNLGCERCFPMFPRPRMNAQF